MTEHALASADDSLRKALDELLRAEQSKRDKDPTCIALVTNPAVPDSTPVSNPDQPDPDDLAAAFFARESRKKAQEEKLPVEEWAAVVLHAAEDCKIKPNEKAHSSGKAGDLEGGTGWFGEKGRQTGCVDGDPTLQGSPSAPLKVDAANEEEEVKRRASMIRRLTKARLVDILYEELRRSVTEKADADGACLDAVRSID